MQLTQHWIDSLCSAVQFGTIDKTCFNYTSGVQFERHETECRTRVLQVYDDQHAAFKNACDVCRTVKQHWYETSIPYISSLTSNGINQFRNDIIWKVSKYENLLFKVYAIEFCAFFNAY